MSGSAPTSVAFQKPGNVTQWTTVGTTQMKTAPTVPAGPAIQASLSVTMGAASLHPGSVMWTTTVETIQMSLSMNAVSSWKRSGEMGRSKAWPEQGDKTPVCGFTENVNPLLYVWMMHIPGPRCKVWHGKSV